MKLCNLLLESILREVHYKNMSKYIHRRNRKFRDEISRINKERILGVALDTSKTFHRVVIFNFSGKIIIKPFSFNVLRSGYDELKRQIKIAQKKIKAERTFVAVESPAKYNSNLLYHLKKDYGHTYLVSPYEVSENRNQRTLVHVKSDDIDASSVGALLVSGEFTEYSPLSSRYDKLKNLIHWRDQKIKIRVMIKHQLEHRLARILPGVNNSYGDLKKVYAHLYESQMHLGLLKLGKTGNEILKLEDDFLIKKFGYEGYNRGHYQIKKLRNRLNEMLLPEEKSTKSEIVFLEKDMSLFEILNEEINKVEREIIEAGSKTSAKYLFNQIAGVGELSASMYVGLLGDIKRFNSAKAVYSYAGLSPRRHQSGTSNKQSLGIKRYGNKLLRSLLFRISTTVIMSNPKYNKYYKRIREEKNKSWRESIIIVSKKLNNVFFALMRDKSDYRE